MSLAVEEVLRALEAAGGRLTLVSGGVVVDPPELLSSELRHRLKACGREVVELLRRRATADERRDRRQNPEIASPSPPVAAVSAPACELRRFADRDDRLVVRFCCEPSHAHSDSVPTFFADEIDVVLAWSDEEGVRPLPVPLRNALLDVKATFGGRVDPSTVRVVGAVAGRP